MEFGTGRGTSAIGRLFLHRMKIKLITRVSYKLLFMPCRDGRQGNPSTW